MMEEIIKESSKIQDDINAMLKATMRNIKKISEGKRGQIEEHDCKGQECETCYEQMSRTSEESSLEEEWFDMK
jgi:hypothetical protein